jgi:hypothetical protein
LNIILSGKLVGYLDKTEQDRDDDFNISIMERRYRKLLRLTVEAIKLSSIQIMDKNKSVESSLEKLLSFRPSIEDMKLIIEPMCYLSNYSTRLITYGESLQRDRYQIILQLQLIKYFLDKYSTSHHDTNDLS